MSGGQQSFLFLVNESAFAVNVSTPYEIDMGRLSLQYPMASRRFLQAKAHLVVQNERFLQNNGVHGNLEGIITGSAYTMC